MEEIRLSKYFTNCGVLSRRAADEAIKNGEITVNGKKAEIGQKIVPVSDRVLYKGREVRPTYERFSYYMLNKPRGFITSMSDDKERKCVTELLSGVSERVYPIGRLDYNSEGLLLFTNDGELANKLTHPSFEVVKTYIVIVSGSVGEEKVQSLQKPVKCDGEVLQLKKVSLVNKGDKKSVIKIELNEGKNREIRRILEANGLLVARLMRVAVGRLELGELPKGKFRALNTREIAYLKNM